MKTSLVALMISLGGSVLFQSACLAAPEANSYQVTGPVISIDDAKIVVQKGKENWEINRKPTTKITGGTVEQIKPGTKVTIHYTMDAATVEIKAAKSAPKTSGTTAVPKG